MANSPAAGSHGLAPNASDKKSLRIRLRMPTNSPQSQSLNQRASVPSDEYEEAKSDSPARKTARPKTSVDAKMASSKVSGGEKAKAPTKTNEVSGEEKQGTQLDESFLLAEETLDDAPPSKPSDDARAKSPPAPTPETDDTCTEPGNTESTVASRARSNPPPRASAPPSTVDDSTEVNGDDDVADDDDSLGLLVTNETLSTPDMMDTDDEDATQNAVGMLAKLPEDSTAFRHESWKKLKLDDDTAEKRTAASKAAKEALQKATVAFTKSLRLKPKPIKSSPRKKPVAVPALTSNSEPPSPAPPPPPPPKVPAHPKRFVSGILTPKSTVRQPPPMPQQAFRVNPVEMASIQLQIPADQLASMGIQVIPTQQQYPMQHMMQRPTQYTMQPAMRAEVQPPTQLRVPPTRPTKVKPPSTNVVVPSPPAPTRAVPGMAAPTSTSGTPVPQSRPPAPYAPRGPKTKACKFTKEHLRDTIPSNASCVIHVLDRRVNLDAFPPDASQYSLIRSWVQDDPYRQIPPTGSNILEFLSLPSDQRVDNVPAIVRSKKRRAEDNGPCDTFANMKAHASGQLPSLNGLRNNLVGKSKRLKREKRREDKAWMKASRESLKSIGINLPVVA